MDDSELERLRLGSSGSSLFLPMEKPNRLDERDRRFCVGWTGSVALRP
jgi:hypothetical protein